MRVYTGSYKIFLLDQYTFSINLIHIFTSHSKTWYNDISILIHIHLDLTMTAFFGFSWLKPLFRTGSNQSRSKTPVRRKSNFVSLCAEALEDRLALAIVNVIYSPTIENGFSASLTIQLPNESTNPVTITVNNYNNGNGNITLAGQHLTRGRKYKGKWRRNSSKE